ncbi:hypothetical protein ACLB2K_063627 [Fragaria x ananassa]
MLEKPKSQLSGLYLTTIKIIESYFVSRSFCNSDSYKLWHDRLGHPERDMMIRILKNSYGHPFFQALKRVGASTATELGDEAVHDALANGSASKALAKTPNASMTISNAHR